MLLNELPPTLLDVILGNHAISYAVIKLWLCGNLALSSRLSRGITYVHLKSLYGAAQCRFPRMLCELRALRYLSISNRDVQLLDNPSDWTFVISRLSGTLETLRIRSLDTRHALMNYAPTPRHTDLVCIERPFADGTSRLLDMDTLFPRLHTLKLRGFARLYAGDLFGLPSTLTRFIADLNINYSELQTAISCLACLPKSLLHLDGVIRQSSMGSDVMHFANDWLSCPPSLESIRTLTAPELKHLMVAPPIFPLAPHSDRVGKRPHYETILRSLPRTLQRCSMAGSWFCWSLETSRTLPPLLENLSLLDIDSDTFTSAESNWAIELPRHLTSLELKPSSQTLTLDAQMITALPRTLTTLSLAFELRLDFSQFSESKSWEGGIWPPTLETLELHGSFHLTPSDLIWLPSALRTLCVPIQTPEHGPLKIEAMWMPEKLTSLELVVSGGLLASQVEVPPSLTKFAYVEQFFESQGIEKKYFEALPSSILTLNMYETPFTRDTLGEAEAWKLPCRLTALSIQEWRCDWLEQLPRTLTSFDCMQLYGLPTALIVQSGGLFEALPHNLTHFAISEMAPDMIDELFVLPSQRFDSLASLTYLTIYGARVASSILQEIPRDLTYLALLLPIIEECDAPYIPSKLTHFFVDEEQLIRPETYLFQHWPLRALGNLIPHHHPIIKDRIAELFN